MRQRQTIFSTLNGGRVVGLVVSLAILSGCVTTGAKTKEAGEITPEASASEQLASALNAKAVANAQKPGGYRDPLVRSVTGAQHAVSEQQGSTGFYPAAPPPPVDSAAGGPTGIAGLVTQPTALNANRSSIYSTPAPIAVRPDGTLAGPAEAYAAPQGAAPAFRNVYSAPMLAPAAMPQQVGIMPPSEQTSQNAAPPQPKQMASMSVPIRSRPTADATPSRILPAPGNSHKLDSQEALMVARSLASKQSQGGSMTLPPGSATAMVPQTNPEMTLTPGMAASLK
ncbi:hypothetical protein [Rhizobium tubonense]|uniref:hypothetical protein n=1 Tax=Rhizobium tubonense TaxID=484088 RepID=UPI0018A81913|nr:hypothetical protein [Rhizobium tubonense]